MKKTITVLLAILTIGLKAQYTPTIVYFSPQSVCPGDEVCAKIFNPDKQPFYFNFGSTSGPEPILLWYTIYPTGNEPDTMEYCFVVDERLHCGKGYIGLNLTYQFVLDIRCDCNSVGIIELTKEKESPIYYDLYGNTIDIRYNEVIIECLGNKRRRVFILN